MRRFFILGALTCGALALLTACTSGDIGSRCTQSGSVAQCVDGAVCAADRSMTTEPPEDPNAIDHFCRELCEVQADCSDGMDCARVHGSMLSACQPRDASSGGDAG